MTKRFKMELLLNSNVFAEGIGKSKKEAEQMAAKKALKIWDADAYRQTAIEITAKRSRNRPLFFCVTQS